MLHETGFWEVKSSVKIKPAIDVLALKKKVKGTCKQLYSLVNVKIIFLYSLDVVLSIG